MSDTDQQFGAAGVEQSQGFYQMPEAPPEKSEELAATEALEKWSQNREQEAAAKPVIDRAYQHIDGDHAGEPYDPHASVPLDRAAKDLAATRDSEAMIAGVERDLELANQIDEARGLRPDLQPADAQQPQDQQPAAQPEQQAAPANDGIDPEVAAAFRNPKILSVLERHHLENNAKVESAINSAAQWAQQNAELAAAAILVRPELQGVHPSQIPGALQALATANPQAAQQIQQQLNHAQTLVQQTNQAKQVQQQRAAIQFQQYAAQQDDAFERSMAAEHPETVRAIRQTAMTMMRESGLTDQQLTHEWNTNALLRSAQGQALLADAARWRMAKAGIKPAPKPVPQVNRPGSSMDRPAAADRDAFALEQRFGGRDAPLTAKQAAELVIGRRARSR